MQTYEDQEVSIMFQHRPEIDCGTIKYIDSGLVSVPVKFDLYLFVLFWLISNSFDVTLHVSVLSMAYLCVSPMIASYGPLNTKQGL